MNFSPTCRSDTNQPQLCPIWAEALEPVSLRKLLKTLILPSTETPQSKSRWRLACMRWVPRGLVGLKGNACLPIFLSLASPQISTGSCRLKFLDFWKFLEIPLPLLPMHNEGDQDKWKSHFRKRNQSSLSKIPLSKGPKVMRSSKLDVSSYSAFLREILFWIIHDYPLISDCNLEWSHSQKW